jgi:hypothetical protein
MTTTPSDTGPSLDFPRSSCPPLSPDAPADSVRHAATADELHSVIRTLGWSLKHGPDDTWWAESAIVALGAILEIPRIYGESYVQTVIRSAKG